MMSVSLYMPKKVFNISSLIKTKKYISLASAHKLYYLRLCSIKNIYV